MKSPLLTMCVLFIFTLVLVDPVAWAQVNRAESNVHIATGDSYFSAKNLNAYINELKATPGETGEFYFAEAKARGECAIFGINPSYVRDAIQGMETNPDIPHAKIRIAMLRRLETRCSGFPETGTHDVSEIPTLYARAALDGSVPAAAHNLVMSSFRTPVAISRRRTIAIIETKNPVAVFELSTLFANNTLRLQTDALINSRESAIAWRLVACKLGLDCSYTSALVQQACLSGGPCGRGSYIENVENDKVSPSRFGEITKAATQILRAVQRNDVTNIIAVGANSVSSQNG